MLCWGHIFCTNGLVRPTAVAQCKAHGVGQQGGLCGCVQEIGEVQEHVVGSGLFQGCLLYTSDAADDM
eukprot:11058127-Prorocentrum_lima.AAC.1